MDIEEAAYAALAIKPKIVIPSIMDGNLNVAFISETDDFTNFRYFCSSIYCKYGAGLKNLLIPHE